MSATDTRAEVAAEAVADARNLLNRVRQTLAGNIGRELTHALAARLIRHLNEARSILKGTRYQPPGDAGKGKERQEKRERLRRRVFALYGSCCGEDRARVLTIDHITPRRGGRRDPRLYQRILSGTEPRELYQVLCVNCNLLKGTGARCAHLKD